MSEAVVMAGAALFSLLNDIGVFFRESYQRMNIWRQHSTNCKTHWNFRINQVVVKGCCLEKYFWLIQHPTGALVTEVITTLNQCMMNNEVIHANH